MQPDAMAGARVLIAETDPITLRLLEAVFGICWCIVRGVSDPHDALREADGFRPKVVVLRFDEVGSPSLELARSLRLRPWAYQTVILGLTANPTVITEGIAKAAGCDALLTLPFDTRALARTEADLLLRRQGDS